MHKYVTLSTIPSKQVFKLPMNKITKITGQKRKGEKGNTNKKYSWNHEQWWWSIAQYKKKHQNRNGIEMNIQKKNRWHCVSKWNGFSVFVFTNCEFLYIFIYTFIWKSYWDDITKSFPFFLRKKKLWLFIVLGHREWKRTKWKFWNARTFDNISEISRIAKWILNLSTTSEITKAFSFFKINFWAHAKDLVQNMPYFVLEYRAVLVWCARAL